jgi:hypothetical protein
MFSLDVFLVLLLLTSWWMEAHGGCRLLRCHMTSTWVHRQGNISLRHWVFLEILQPRTYSNYDCTFYNCVFQNLVLVADNAKRSSMIWKFSVWSIRHIQRWASGTWLNSVSIIGVTNVTYQILLASVWSYATCIFSWPNWIHHAMCLIHQFSFDFLIQVQVLNKLRNQRYKTESNHVLVFLQAFKVCWPICSHFPLILVL